MSHSWSIIERLNDAFLILSNINSVSSYSPRWVGRKEACEGVKISDRNQQRLLAGLVSYGWLEVDNSNPRGYRLSKQASDYIKTEALKIKTIEAIEKKQGSRNGY